MTRPVFVIGIALMAAGVVRAGAQARPAGTPAKTASSGPTATPPRVAARPLPNTRNDISPTIRGNLVNASDIALPNTAVRLRDARLGRLVGTEVTDDAGLFSFTAIDPGSYVVEVLDGDRKKVVAASDIINVNAGDVVTAVVKLPARAQTLATMLGGRGPSAVAVAAEAAAAGILATTVVGTATSDRPIR